MGELPGRVEVGEGKVATVDVRQAERIEPRLPGGFGTAYQVVANDRRDLPIGSTWDAASGIFYWQPAPAFLGRYELVFSGTAGSITVRARVSP